MRVKAVILGGWEGWGSLLLAVVVAVAVAVLCARKKDA
jgi:hypothetical protein